jgi:NAD(P)H-dependent flavin oxidoreductase YrpB (nitropropane dioxygenase family)
MRTPLCDVLKIDVPIILAPMGRQSGPPLAAAVSNAGGLGTIALWVIETSKVRDAIRRIKSLTDRPFAANLNMAFPQDERLSICIEEQVPIISFFWGDAGALAAKAKNAGARVVQTVGSASEAKLAVSNGADVIVAQGWEAGGHVWGKVATLPLVPSVVDAVGNVPVVAAGGIADGRGMAAALALGAAGVWIGTRFLASREANLHTYYVKRLIGAAETDTVHLNDLFDGEWPNAPHRVLRNSTVEAWERAGQPKSGNRPGEGEVIASSPSGGDVLRYSVRAAVPETDGDLEALPMWAGQSVGLVNTVLSAADIVREIDTDAAAILQRLGRPASP